MIRVVLVAAVLAVASAPHAEAEGAPARTVILKERPSSADGVITLSDLFENAGEAGATLVARAPAPGEVLSLDPDHVRRAAARAGLDWANAGGVQRVSVARAARTSSAEEIAAAIEAALFRETGETLQVELANRRLALHAPLDAAGGLRVRGVEREADGRFTARLLPYEGAAPVEVAGRAVAVAEAPVLRRPLARGDIVARGDVEWVRLRADRLPADAVLALDALVGREARRSLRPGEALRAYDLVEPAAVTRGEIVSLVYERGPLLLTVRARALEDAPVDAPARFMNLQSNRTVEAIVEGPGRARIGASPATAS